MGHFHFVIALLEHNTSIFKGCIWCKYFNLKFKMDLKIHIHRESARYRVTVRLSNGNQYCLSFVVKSEKVSLGFADNQQTLTHSCLTERFQTAVWKVIKVKALK